MRPFGAAPTGVPWTPSRPQRPYYRRAPLLTPPRRRDVGARVARSGDLDSAVTAGGARRGRSPACRAAGAVRRPCARPWGRDRRSPRHRGRRRPPVPRRTGPAAPVRVTRTRVSRRCASRVSHRASIVLPAPRSLQSEPWQQSTCRSSIERSVEAMRPSIYPPGDGREVGRREWARFPPPYDARPCHW